MSERDERPARPGEESLVVAPERGLEWAERVAALVLVVAFSAAGGLAGVFAAAAAIGVRIALGTPYAVAVGTVALLAVFPDGVEPLQAALIGAGLLALVLAPTRHTPNPAAFAAGTIAAAASAGGLAWWLVRVAPLWLAAAVLVAALAAAAYGLHRYELVRLGLVNDATTTDDNA